jgi:cytochrome P450
MSAPRLPAELAQAIVDPYAHADASRIHGVFTQMRAEYPLARAEVEGCEPFWAVTKHADILEISRQNALFLNGAKATTFTTIAAGEQVKKITGTPHLVKSLVQMDPPEHHKYRLLTQAWFLPQNLRKLEPRLRELARIYVDRMVEKGGSCDFAADVAAWYPLRVIMDILGVPESDEPRMLKLTQELFGATDPELGRTGGFGNLMDDDAVASLQAVVMDFFQYFNAITEDRRANPRDDVASVIANGQVDGQPLDPFNAMSYYVILAAAGHDTTSASTAGGMWALIDNPAEFRKLKDNPALMPQFVDEAIRWTTPVRHFMRTATQDYELRGQKIKAGDWLMLCYPSGNRDEEVFEDPFSFRVDRNPNKLLSFGFGAHVCVGQHLAKMEMRALFDELIPRLESIEFNGTPRLSAANFVNGPKKMPVSYKMN